MFTVTRCSIQLYLQISHRTRSVHNADWGFCCWYCCLLCRPKQVVSIIQISVVKTRKSFVGWHRRSCDCV